jgi:hypothetical protein
VTDSLFPDVEAHVVDTNLFVTFERHDTVELLERAVKNHDIRLLLPARVYDELTPANYPCGRGRCGASDGGPTDTPGPDLDGPLDYESTSQ